jgi:glycosyltransferase involved in cell wall biosynthesis
MIGLRGRPDDSECPPGSATVGPCACHPTVAILWQRFGPYHLARLQAAERALRAHGWSVVGLEVAGADEYAWDRPGGSVSRRTLFPEVAYASLDARRIRRAVTSALDAIGPAAVCINGWAVPEAVAALRWCRARKRRAVLMSESFEPSKSPIKEWVKRRRVRRFHAAIVGGSWHASYLSSLGFARPIELGYDVVDNRHFAEGGAWAGARCGSLAGNPYLFANVRFLERKGIDALLRAYARYRMRAASAHAGRPVWHLVISGGGEKEPFWKRLALDLDVADTVHWPGFLQYAEVAAAYRSAGMFVHPARREAWGLVVNEAAAAGLPLIVGRRVGAACELVRDGENGFLVDPDDEHALAGVVTHIATMPDEARAAMGAASRRLAARFEPERFGEAVRRSITGAA